MFERKNIGPEVETREQQSSRECRERIALLEKSPAVQMYQTFREDAQRLETGVLSDAERKSKENIIRAMESHPDIILYRALQDDYDIALRRHPY